MKIVRVKIENYKSILNQTVDGFTHVNMVYGHNNSGKSNYLKCINYIFCRKFSAENLPRVDESRIGAVPQLTNEATSNFWEGIIKDAPYIFRNNDRNTNISFEVDFTETKEAVGQLKYFDLFNEQFFEDPSEFTISLKGEIVSRGLYDAEIKLSTASLNGEVIFNSETGGYFETADADTELASNGYEAFGVLLSFFNDSVLFIDNDRYFSEEEESSKRGVLSPRHFKNWIHNLSLDPERYSQLKHIVSEVSAYKPTGDAEFKEAEKSSPINNDFQFQFSRLENLLNLFLNNGHNLRLPIESYGTGIQQVLYLLTKIAEKNPRIILIEELELNLSPKYQLEILQHFLIKYILIPGKRLKQIYFTTHSPILFYRADFQIHNVVMNKRGETEIIRHGDVQQKIKEFYPPETVKLLIEQRGV